MILINKILFLLLFISNYSYGQLYYVSTTGNNDNPGTLNQPWKTIQHACDIATAGSTIYIMGGTYNEKIEIKNSGTDGNYIWFQNYNSSEVIIDGTGITDKISIIKVSDKSYIIIKGLSVKNNQMNDAQGIIIEGNCNHIEIRNNKISYIDFSSDPNASVDENTNSQPLIVYGSDPDNSISGLIIDGNEISDCRTGYSEGLAVNGNVDGFEITNNLIHNISNIGIDIIGFEGTCENPEMDQARNGLVKKNTVYNCKSPYAPAAGIYADGSRDIVIENNNIYKNQWGIEVGCENTGKSASGIIVRNNLIYYNDKAAIAAGGFDYPENSGKVVNCSFTNNTCYNNDQTNDYYGELCISYTEDCVFKNNIFFCSEQNIMWYMDVSPVNLIFDYNLYYSPGGINNAEFSWNNTSYSGFEAYRSGTGQDPNSFFDAPAFRNSARLTLNLHIINESPAIDAGDPSFIPAPGETDIDGDYRISNSRVDIGADEYYIPTAILDKFLETSVRVYPNPAKDYFIVDLGDKKIRKAILRLYDHSGKLIIQKHISSGEKIYINKLTINKGVYIFQIFSGNTKVGQGKIALFQ